MDLVVDATGEGWKWAWQKLRHCRYIWVDWWWFQHVFYVHPYLGKVSNLTIIFFRGVGSTTSQVWFDCWLSIGDDMDEIQVLAK